MELNNAVAIVTGGASGLGRATTERLLADGMQVVMIDLNEQAGNAAAQELGDKAHFVQANVADEDQVKKAIDTATALGDLRDHEARLQREIHAADLAAADSFLAAGDAESAQLMLLRRLPQAGRPGSPWPPEPGCLSS